ncbi:hypothetical protein ACFLQM_00555, partial [Acidobacteriota bacterium]
MEKLKFTAFERLQLYDLDRRGSNITTDDLFFRLSKHGLHLDLRSFSGQDHKPLYFEGYQRPPLRSRTGITTIKALSDVQHTLSAVARNLPRESVTPFGEFLAQRQAPISGNNSPSSNQYIDRDISPFDTEIPPFISRLSRRLDGLEDKNTGLRATLVLAKQSHM